MGRQPRQRPISCHLCRVRKLRCSRQFPCSNCTSRGIACLHDTVPPSNAAPVRDAPIRGGPGPDIPIPDAPVKTATGTGASTDVLSRLERLEALVASQGRIPQSPHESYASPSTYAESSQTGQTPTDTASPMTPRLQRMTADALWLERSCAGQTSLDSLVSEPVIFRTCPIRLITKPFSFVFQNTPSPALSEPAEPVKCVWLPQREEAHVLLVKYLRDITHLNHIIHGPSMHPLVEDVYSALDRNDRVDLGAVVLLLSVCASSTLSWTTHDDVQSLFQNHKDANAQTTSWVKATLDVVDHAHRTAHVSMECIQGMLVLFFTMCNLEGISHHARALIAKSIGMARELALHRIDYRHNATVPEPVRMSSVKTELGRRVWWSLTSADWMLAQFSVPQEGTYTIHPAHMAVNKPRNANDSDIVDGREIIDRPLSEPTDMSYLLQRIRLAEVCHGLLERNPLMLLSPENLDYGQILEVDAKLRQFLQELPEFFSFENTAWRHLPPTDPRRSPAIIIQHYTINLLIHRQLCKLHLPYLARGTVEPAFAYSRDVCLKSARSIVQTEHQLKTEHLLPLLTNARLAMVLRCVFLASIALVLDACLRSDSDESWGDVEAMTTAWRILEAEQDHSPTAAKLLGLSIQVLRKHKPTHPALDALPKQVPEAHSHSLVQGALPMTPESTHRGKMKMGVESPYVGPECEIAYLEQQWQGLEGRMDLDAADWDRLFWGLDAPFI